METIINYQIMETLKQSQTENKKYNTVWGVEYLLMDSNTFMGDVNGNRYDTVIDVLTKIRQTKQNRIFT